MEKTDCPVEAALQQFAASRPPGIYKDEYIKELYCRYDDVADAPNAPPLPDWCFDEEESPDDYESPSNASNMPSLPSSYPHNADPPSSSRTESPANNKRSANEMESANEAEQQTKKKKKNEFLNLNATFMAGVSGVTLVTDKVIY